MGAKHVRKARSRPEPWAAWPSPKTGFDVSPAARRSCLHNTTYDKNDPSVEWIPDPDAEHYPVALEQGLFDILRLIDVPGLFDVPGCATLPEDAIWRLRELYGDVMNFQDSLPSDHDGWRPVFPGLLASVDAKFVAYAVNYPSFQDIRYFHDLYLALFGLTVGKLLTTLEREAEKRRVAKAAKQREVRDAAKVLKQQQQRAGAAKERREVGELRVVKEHQSTDVGVTPAAPAAGSAAPGQPEGSVHTEAERREARRRDISIMGANRVRKARREDGKLCEVKAESQAGLQAIHEAPPRRWPSRLGPTVAEAELQDEREAALEAERREARRREAVELREARVAAACKAERTAELRNVEATKLREANAQAEPREAKAQAELREAEREASLEVNWLNLGSRLGPTVTEEAQAALQDEREAALEAERREAVELREARVAAACKAERAAAHAAVFARAAALEAARREARRREAEKLREAKARPSHTLRPRARAPAKQQRAAAPAQLEGFVRLAAASEAGVGVTH